MPNSLIDAEANRLLDLSLLDTDKLCLMSNAGNPGVEVVGGGYARQTIDWGPAAGRRKSSVAAIAFVEMPETAVQGWEVRDSVGVRKWAGLIDSRTVSAVASTDTFSSVTAHGLALNDKVVFASTFTGLPTAVYYVRDVTTLTFKVSLTSGGTAMDVSADAAAIAVGRAYSTIAGGGFTLAAGQVSCALA